MKKLVNLKDVKALSKMEQKNISGGEIGIRTGCPEICGNTGCLAVNSNYCVYDPYSSGWYNGQCYVCL